MGKGVPLAEELGVTPFVGVWIETSTNRPNLIAIRVTPFVGVWIETSKKEKCGCGWLSHPSWVCGLKPLILDYISILLRHTLRGCVD